MSLWQHKNTHKRHLLWLKLYVLCLLFHCAFLVWIFSIYNNSLHTVSLSLNKHVDYAAPVFFVPPSVIPIVMNTQSSSHNETIISKQKKEDPPIIEKQVHKKIETTTIAPSPVKKEPEQKKIISTSTPSKTTTSPTQPIKKETREQKKQIPPIEAKHTKTIIPENAQISHNYKEVDLVRRNALLQKELVQNWKPPIGIPESTTCDISFFVDIQGNIKNIIMVQSSGILMYDISARQALFSMKMPQWTYGKTVTITFKI